MHNAAHATGIASDIATIGGTIYGMANQPHVERGSFLHNAGHAMGIASDIANIAGTGYMIANQP